jgi:hypothetical protein
MAATSSFKSAHEEKEQIREMIEVIWDAEKALRTGKANLKI